MVLLSYFLSPEVLLHCDWVIGAPLDSGIIGHNNTLYPETQMKHLHSYTYSNSVILHLNTRTTKASHRTV